MGGGEGERVVLALAATPVDGLELGLGLVLEPGMGHTAWELGSGVQGSFAATISSSKSIAGASNGVPVPTRGEESMLTPVRAESTERGE